MKNIALTLLGAGLCLAANAAKADCIENGAQYGYELGNAYCDTIIRAFINQSVNLPTAYIYGPHICDPTQTIACKANMKYTVERTWKYGTSCLRAYHSSTFVGNYSTRQLYTSVQHECDFVD